MRYELEDTSKVIDLFEGWQETMIYSCLQSVMGKIYVTDLKNPKSAMAFIGCFGFLAGIPNEELIKAKPEGFTILVPQNKEWCGLIEECCPTAKAVSRFAIKKNTIFNLANLNEEIEKLPDGFELRKIDALLYDKCLQNPATCDFVSSFESKEKYLELGRGIVILKDGEIISGASSYSRYNDGIEIEVDTIEPYRRKHLALIAAAALIKNCLEEGLYPSWDAQNMGSVYLAQKLGYEFDHEYTAYEVP